jgi:hypothetical protein
MDSENKHRYQKSPNDGSAFGDQSQAKSFNNGSHPVNGSNGCNTKLSLCKSLCENADEILAQLQSGKLLMVNSRRRNGLILCKLYHAEFAGPGAAVGTFFDEDCQQVIPVGDLSLISPDSHEERQKAYLIRRQWIRLTHQFTEKSVPIQRAQAILNQFETYFDQETISKIPDEAFAMLIGVMPHTVRKARRTPGQFNVKVKA